MASISDVLRRAINPYLLEQQFCRIRNHKLSHILGAFAICTPTPVSEEAASLTCIYFKFIRRNHQTLKQKLGCAITNETVALHFAKAQTALTGTAFGGLSCQRCAWSSKHDQSATGRETGQFIWNFIPCPSVHLVHYHVFLNTFSEEVEVSSK